MLIIALETKSSTAVVKKHTLHHRYTVGKRSKKPNKCVYYTWASILACHDRKMVRKWKRIYPGTNLTKLLTLGNCVKHIPSAWPTAWAKCTNMASCLSCVKVKMKVVVYVMFDNHHHIHLTQLFFLLLLQHALQTEADSYCCWHLFFQINLHKIKNAQKVKEKVF